ncbi:MAG TPA: tetratricopeptide repeat protein [Candidatus Acidoferrales bacterium]|nr:tetratricopeptide repeat protein [Candidatus Acidoferrales bacterium]
MKLNRSIRMGRLAASAGALAALAFLVVGTAGCNKLKARDLINQGVAAFKSGKYDDAVEDFKKARDLDPDLLVARVYLATAYANQYIPGAPSEENIKRGNQAIAEFQDLLQKDPKNVSALDGIGSLLFNMAASPFNPQKFEESKSYHERHIQLKPGDPEPYYWVGVIDWTLAYRANAEMRAEYNKNNIRKQVKDTDPLPAKVREQYSARYSGMVEEGIKNIQEAIRLRPEYEDAIIYLNLLYRRKADMVQAEQEREALLKQADDLMEKVKVIKQKKLEAPPQQSS